MANGNNTKVLMCECYDKTILKAHTILNIRLDKKMAMKIIYMRSSQFDQERDKINLNLFTHFLMNDDKIE